MNSVFNKIVPQQSAEVFKLGRLSVDAQQQSQELVFDILLRSRVHLLWTRQEEKRWMR